MERGQNVIEASKSNPVFVVAKAQQVALNSLYVTFSVRRHQSKSSFKPATVRLIAENTKISQHGTKFILSHSPVDTWAWNQYVGLQ